MEQLENDFNIKHFMTNIRLNKMRSEQNDVVMSQMKKNMEANLKNALLSSVNRNRPIENEESQEHRG